MCHGRVEVVWGRGEGYARPRSGCDGAVGCAASFGVELLADGRKDRVDQTQTHKRNDVSERHRPNSLRLTRDAALDVELLVPPCILV